MMINIRIRETGHLMLKGESYITKGESDIRKIFIIFWVILMTILLAVTFIIIG